MIGIFVGIFISFQQMATNKRIADASNRIENLRTEFSKKVMEGQLAVSLIDPLFKGSESEKLAALFILENSTSVQFNESILAAFAAFGKDETMRTKAIAFLMKKGKSAFTSEILKQINSEGATPEERRFAAIATQAVENRQKVELKETLKIANAYYEARLYQSAVEEFKKVEELMTGTNIDQAELVLAKFAYDLKNYQEAAMRYIKATKKI